MVTTRKHNLTMMHRSQPHARARAPNAREVASRRTIAACIGAGLCLSLFGCRVRQTTDAAGSPPVSNEEPLPRGVEVEEASDSDSVSDLRDTATAAIAEGNSVLEYDLDHPSTTISLPDALREISDITVLSGSEVACVQDEQGIVYVYDLGQKRITDQVHFASHGDYEGLALVGSQVYVLRSDGVLFRLASLKRHPAVQKVELRLPFRESESLCLDPQHDRLLIAPKSHDQSGTGKDIRSIYAFDLRQQMLAKAPAFEISLRSIRRFAKHHDLPVPRRQKRNGDGMHNALHFMPSAIAINPISHEVFIVSAVDHVLVSCDTNGRVTGYAVLDAAIFRQPEGIAFLPNGDMIISNEGAGKAATLVLLRRGHKGSPVQRPPLSSAGL